MHKIPFLIILLIGISLIPLSFSESIPQWVKNTASWWSEREISQSEFTTGLEFLINEGIIYIPPTEPGIPGPDKIIPDWVRNTAGWWSTDKIPDSEFINAMKYLIEIGIIEVDTFSPEILDLDEDVQLAHSTPSGTPLNIVLEGYDKAHADGKFILDVKIFDAEKYSGTEFGSNWGATLDGVNIDISLYDEEGELIHSYNDVTQNGLVRYEVMAKETSQAIGSWLVNNLYSVQINAAFDGQTAETTYQFYGTPSQYAYTSGSAKRAPTDLSATAGDDQVTLSWTAPAGVKGITDYRIEYSLNIGSDGIDNDGDGSTDEADEKSFRSWTTFAHTASSAVTDVVDGLESEKTYYFRVAAENYSGTGKYSAEVTATTT